MSESFDEEEFKNKLSKATDEGSLSKIIDDYLDNHVFAEYGCLLPVIRERRKQLEIREFMRNE